MDTDIEFESALRLVYVLVHICRNDGACWGQSLIMLDVFLGTFRRLGGSWKSLGIFGAPCALQGELRRLRGASGEVPGTSLGVHWDPLRTLGGASGVSWGSLGAT